MEFVQNLFKGRINRRNLLYGRVASVIVFLLLIAIDYVIFNSVSNSLMIIAFALLYIILLSFNISMFARRLHDLNYSGWWALLEFIPFINFLLILYLFFKQGEQRANKYGPKPSARIVFPQDILGR